MGFDKTPRDRLEKLIDAALWDDIDISGAIIEGLLAHPEDVIALLGGEQVGWQLPSHDLRVMNAPQGVSMDKWVPVYRFSREETP